MQKKVIEAEKSKKYISMILLLMSFIAFFCSIYFVSAAYSGGGVYDPRTGMEDLIDIAVDFGEPLLSAILGGDNWDGRLLFEKLILFVLLVSVVYVSMKKVKIFEDNDTVLWIVSLAVPLIGIRFINFEWLNTILIEYKVLGIALTSGLPFVIYFFFLNNVFADYPAMRKIGWIFFACIFIGLWITSSEQDQAYGVVYFWTAAASFIFLLLDGTINRYMLMQKVKDSGKKTIADQIVVLTNQIQETEKLPDSDFKTKRLKELRKSLAKYHKAYYK